ncbi:hypothetical protein EVAR_53372_1 [Eumeta japonica]|uniref:Uncharacterized protein n=1 Tax=Eumeta variegata TaxID=151549 RepID=A0A4C1Y8C0_EUMVA|nr:hypothetical protein EVAR_53372_1 [Eumeta japonica]
MSAYVIAGIDGARCGAAVSAKVSPQGRLLPQQVAADARGTSPFAAVVAVLNCCSRCGWDGALTTVFTRAITTSATDGLTCSRRHLASGLYRLEEKTCFAGIKWIASDIRLIARAVRHAIICEGGVTSAPPRRGRPPARAASSLDFLLNENTLPGIFVGRSSYRFHGEHQRVTRGGGDCGYFGRIILGERYRSPRPRAHLCAFDITVRAYWNNLRNRR